MNKRLKQNINPSNPNYNRINEQKQVFDLRVGVAMLFCLVLLSYFYMLKINIIKRTNKKIVIMVSTFNC